MTPKISIVMAMYNIPKFDGKLKLIHSKKDSGGCAVPRNIGMGYASGKYNYRRQFVFGISLTS